MFDWLNLDDVYNNLLATLIWVVIASLISFIFRARIARFLKKVLPQIDSSVPHIDYSMIYNERGDYTTDIKVSNQGGEPAYNVNIILYSKSYVTDNNYSLRSLSETDVQKGVLGVGQEVVFDGVSIQFEEGGLTRKNEIWVEYDNAAGVHFRTVVEPVSPRGDGPKVNPPRVIKKRLENIPGFNISETSKKWKKFENGKGSLFPREGLIKKAWYLIIGN